MRLHFVAVLVVFTAARAVAVEPDYSAWDTILSRYYNASTSRMNYRALKQNDRATLNQLRDRLAAVDVTKLTRDERLAYWINLYNVNVVAVVVDHYPVKSIRDISTDPIRRLDVFERDLVPYRRGRISLNDIEHKELRERFRDPRIHFAINCAARSCPPMPARAVRGPDVDEVLDAQTIAFLNHPRKVEVVRDGTSTVIRTTKIMEWFKEDFERWGGGTLNFIEQYFSPARKRLLAGKVRVEYKDYDWSLNEAK